MARRGRGRGRGRGCGNVVVGSDRITRAYARREQLESPELSSDDSLFNLVLSEEEESVEVSVIDSEGVEPIEEVEEMESVESEDDLQAEEPEIESGHGNVPAVATVGLDQFFSCMERHLERQMHTLTDRTETREEPTDNPMLRIVREMENFADVSFRGSGDPAIAE